MPAARAWFRMGTVGLRVWDVVGAGAAMVMSRSWGRCVGVRWAACVVGLELGDRDQRQTDVAKLVQQAVQSGLVDDGTSEQAEAVTGGEGHRIEPGGPSGVEAPPEADLVPAGPVRGAGGRGAHDRKVGADSVSAPHIVW